MEDPSSHHWILRQMPLRATVPAVILDQDGDVMASHAADGTRVFSLPASDRSISTLVARSASDGWHVQGIRKIGDRLFVEHIALSPDA